ncbi:hypothetical protein G7054_g15106 [Neopestalotiopsis clavispora]|nr:hypothetical protein G7054_g15106 [Neopestalotiopsis clavispora]
MLGHYSIREGENSEIRKFIPSYQISIEDVYIDIARRALLGDCSSLITLAAVQHIELPDPTSPTTKTPGQLHLPSWVPDWRTYQSHILSEPTSPHRASNMVPDVEFGPSHRILRVRGAIISRLTACSQTLKLGDFYHNNSQKSSIIQILWSTICKHDHFDLDHKYVTGESALFAYTQTLSNGCVAIAWHQTRKYNEVACDAWLRHGAAYVVEASGASSFISEHVRTLAQGGNAHEWVRAASGASSNRRFGRTECGRYVLGPAVMREDDIVCILFGGTMPFVLRSTGSSYQLVGECYCHGLMDNEIIGILQESEVKEILFDIS